MAAGEDERRRGAWESVSSKRAGRDRAGGAGKAWGWPSRKAHMCKFCEGCATMRSAFLRSARRRQVVHGIDGNAERVIQQSTRS